MVVGIGLLAALVFGSGVVLQQRAAMQEPAANAARPSFLWRLVQRPLWLFGLGADVIGFGLQALALHSGSLVVVQPLITLSLIFTLGLSAIAYHEAIAPPEWLAVIMVVAGLALFLAAAAPTGSGISEATQQAWILCAISITVVIAVTLGPGLRAKGARRAGLLGLSAGIADAFMAVLAKAFSDSFGGGIGGALVSWTPYALIAGGIVALLLTSTAYQAGFPTVSLPIITVADPVIGSIIGITLFGERLQLGGLRAPLVVVAIGAMFGGLFVLARDRTLSAEVTGTALHDNQGIA